MIAAVMFLAAALLVLLRAYLTMKDAQQIMVNAAATRERGLAFYEKADARYAEALELNVSAGRMLDEAKQILGGES